MEKRVPRAPHPSMDLQIGNLTVGQLECMIDLEWAIWKSPGEACRDHDSSIAVRSRKRFRDVMVFCLRRRHPLLDRRMSAHRLPFVAYASALREARGQRLQILSLL